jgi:uncharacterized protein
MEKDTIKILIAEYQQKATEVSLMERNYKIENNLNYVFTGLRRAGKSYMMYNIIRQLLDSGYSKQEILYFNFEDDRIATIEAKDLDKIKLCYQEMYESKPIFFLDEIQIVDHWEKFARRLVDQGYRVFVTGSNAKMLSNEIATTLGGRFMIKNIFPYSFTEFLLSQGIDISDKNFIYKHRNDTIRMYETYFRFGGLPELSKISDKRSWLSNLYQKIFLGDIITRYQVRNSFALQILIRKLAESIKQPISYNRLAHIISSSGKKISTDTVIDYLEYMKESWLIFSVENIAAKLADKFSNRKYYFTDNGILNLFLIDPLTALLENQVALELRRLYGSDVYYYNNGVEVDFFVLEKQLAIQVSYSIKNIETHKREINALLKMAKHIDVSDMLILTKDDEDIIEGESYRIKVIPVWKWLLANS